MAKEPVLEVAFSGGIDESTRDEIADAARTFPVLENTRQDKRGGASKRLGYDYLELARLDGTSRSAGRKLFSAGDRACTIDGTYLDVYSETSGAWTTVASVPEASATVLDAPSVSSTSARACDVAVCNGYIVVAQTDGLDLVLSVQDEDGTVIRAGDSPSNMSVARLATYGTYVVATYVLAGNANVNVTYLDTTSAATLAAGWSTPATVATNKILAGAGASRALAMAAFSDRVAVAYVNNSGGASELTVKTWSVASGVLETLNVNTSSATPDAIDLAAESTTLWVSWNETLDVRVMGTTGASLATTLATTATVVSALSAVSGIRLGAGHASGKGRVLLQDVASLRSQGFQTTAGAVTTDGSTALYLFTILATRPVLRGTSYYAAAYQFYDLAQTTSEFVLVDVSTSADTLRPVASVEPGLVVPSDGYNVPGIVALGSSTYVTATHLARSSTVNAAKLVRYDFADPLRWQAVEHAGSTYFTGGVLVKFDGARLAEVPFLSRPYTPDITKNAGAVLSPTVGYRWVATFETCDGDGNWIVGSVSLPSAVSATGAAASFTITSSPLTITTRYGTYSSTNGTRIAFYRTLDGGSVYYFVSAADVNPSTTPSITDATTDTTLAARARLYGTGVLPGTNGAGQDRRAPPGFTCLVSYNDMLVGASGSTLSHSGQAVLGEGVWFNPVFRLDMVDGGAVTALAAQDGTLFVFKRRSIFAVNGEPPADNGSSGGLGTPRRLACDVGCIDPRSVVVTAAGVFFQSERGIELLTRGQSVEWLGEQVHATLASYPVITSATLDSAQGLVRFTCAASETANVVSDTGVHLVFDLTIKAWVSKDKVTVTTNASRAAQSACMAYLGGAWRFAWLDKDGTVYREELASSGTAHLDSQTYWVTQAAETANVHIAGLQGEQNIDRILVLAEKHTAHDVTIQVAHDYSGSYTESKTFSAALLATLGRQWLDRELVKSTSQALKVRISDATPSSGTVGTGKGATWVALTFSGERKSGVKRTSSAERGT